MAEKIKNVLVSLYDEEIIWKVKLLENWQSIIGSIDSHVILLNIKDSSLVLGVSHPAWVQELQSLKSVIQDNVNKFLGEKYIKNILFQVIAKKKSFSPETVEKKSPSLRKIEHRTLNFDQESALNKIKNKELKDALCHYLAFCKPPKD